MTGSPTPAAPVAARPGRGSALLAVALLGGPPRVGGRPVPPGRAGRRASVGRAALGPRWLHPDRDGARRGGRRAPLALDRQHGGREQLVRHTHRCARLRRDSARRGCDQLRRGLLPVSWRWHHESFTALPQMFDPLANASCVARFLRELHDGTGDWSAAAGAYRSRTPEHATRYRAAFDAHRATAADEGRLDVSTVVAQAPAPRANTFPLLTEPAGAPRLGSLVPTDG